MKRMAGGKRESYLRPDDKMFAPPTTARLQVDGWLRGMPISMCSLVSGSMQVAVEN